MTINELEAIPADENGIVSVTIDGEQRRFVKEKFHAWLLKNAHNGIVATIKKAPAKVITKKAPVLIVKKNPIGYHMKKKVVAIMPDGTEKEFDSRKKASDELGLDLTGITNMLKGRQRTVKGLRFREAV